MTSSIHPTSPLSQEDRDLQRAIWASLRLNNRADVHENPLPDAPDGHGAPTRLVEWNQVRANRRDKETGSTVLKIISLVGFLFCAYSSFSAIRAGRILSAIGWLDGCLIFKNIAETPLGLQKHSTWIDLLKKPQRLCNPEIKTLFLKNTLLASKIHSFFFKMVVLSSKWAVRIHKLFCQ
jgi:hypothetical protein